MEDYLKDLCDRWDIKLVYTQNKITVLSCTTPQDVPNLRVHRSFRGCPKRVAHGVLRWCIGIDDGDDLQLIECYVEEETDKDQFEVKKPNPRFAALLYEDIKTQMAVEECPSGDANKEGATLGQQFIPSHLTPRHQEESGASGAETDKPPAQVESTLGVRLAFSLLLTLVGASGVISKYFGLAIAVPLDDPWIQLALATPVQLVAGWHLYAEFLGGATHPWTKIGFFIGLGAAAAYGWSLAVLVGSINGSSVFFASYVGITAALLGQFSSRRLLPAVFRLAAALREQYRRVDYHHHNIPSNQTDAPESEGWHDVSRYPEYSSDVKELPFELTTEPDDLTEMEIVSMSEQLSGREKRSLSLEEGIRPDEEQLTMVELVVSELKDEEQGEDDES